MDKKWVFGLIILGTIGIAFATTGGLGSLAKIFWGIACEVNAILLPAAFLAMIAAAVIYAFGQVGHAEMRAKAQSWAMWALIAGITALVIVLIMPTILMALFTSGGATAPASFPGCCATALTGDPIMDGAGCG